MKAVILAGGLGTRLSEYTELIPKPMVTIGDKPILLHIMDYYAKFGISEFVIAAGYRADVIKKYFIELPSLNSDFTIDLQTGRLENHTNLVSRNWKVTVVDTGLESMTGGRLLRLRKYINDERFFLTYGDGLSNVNLDKLLEKHLRSESLVTVTAVRPVARFGELKIFDGLVASFKEKPQLEQGHINGGFFVVEPAFLEYIRDDGEVLEGYPLEETARLGKLGAYEHEGFWQCMDTKRDRDFLESLISSKEAPWENPLQN